MGVGRRGGGSIYPLVLLRNGYLSAIFTVLKHLGLSLHLIGYNQVLLLHGNMWLKISVLMYKKSQKL